MDDMLKKRMLINAEYDETRIAIVENQRLENFYFEKIEQHRRRDNIYCAVVETIEPSLQAVFINYGGRRHGFLAIDDVNFAALGIVQEPQTTLKIQDILKIGQKVLVQGLRDEIGNKCASFSMNLKLRGRFMIFLPHQRNGIVSKKITDPQEHQRLKIFIEGLKNSHQDSSAIIRSVSEGRSLSDLKKDFIALQGQYQTICQQFSKARGGSLLQQEASTAIRILREDFSETMTEVCVDHPETFQDVQYFFKQHLPKYQKNVKLYLGNRSIFTEYGIERQVEALQSSQVALPSGGGIVIDQTEALVAIDVNSGSARQGDSVEETAIRTNLEAVEEIAKQLRLRNLGGLVVVDFIDMRSPANRKEVVEAMRLATKRDRAQFKLGGISKFGLFEMSRQRMDSSVMQNVQNRCPACRGTGLQPTSETNANDVLRKIREIAALEQVIKIKVFVDHTLASHLFNYKRSHLEEIELASGVQVLWEIKTPDLLNGQTIFEFLRAGQSRYKQFVFRDKPLPALPKTTTPEHDPVEKKLPEPPVPKIPHLKIVSEQTEIPSKKEVPTQEQTLQILPFPQEKQEKATPPKTEERIQVISQEKTESAPNEVKSGKLFSSVHRPYPEDAVPLPKIPEKQNQWQDVPIFTTIYRSEHQEENTTQAPLIEAIEDEEALAKPKKKAVKAPTRTKKKADASPETTEVNADVVQHKQTPVEAKLDESVQAPLIEAIEDEEALAKPKKKAVKAPTRTKKKADASPETTEVNADVVQHKQTPVEAKLDESVQAPLIEAIEDEEALAKPKKKAVKAPTRTKKKADASPETTAVNVDSSALAEQATAETKLDESVQAPLIEAIEDEEALAKPKKKKTTTVKKEDKPKKKATSRKKKTASDDSVADEKNS